MAIFFDSPLTTKAALEQENLYKTKKGRLWATFFYINGY